jgi:hypothetical protein
MIFPSLIKPLYQWLEEFNNGEITSYDKCGAKFVSLLFCDTQSWKIVGIHNCNKCIIPSDAIVVNIDNAINFLTNLPDEEIYHEYISKSISLIISLAKVQ